MSIPTNLPNKTPNVHTLQFKKISNNNNLICDTQQIKYPPNIWILLYLLSIIIIIIIDEHEETLFAEQTCNTPNFIVPHLLSTPWSCSNLLQWPLQGFILFIYLLWIYWWIWFYFFGSFFSIYCCVL